MPAINTGPVIDNPGSQRTRPDLSGAGANASTWVGIIVLASLATFYLIRRSFRRNG